MTNLIVHVGPGKCGSSSIQHFFSSTQKPCIQNTRYKPLIPSKISELNCKNPRKSISDFFTKIIFDNPKECDTLILSHEFLFQCPYAVKNICVIADSLVTNTSIIGYSRKQSDFLISAYSQWLFRSPERIEEVRTVIKELKLQDVLFSGLERQLIASIANDFFSARQLSGYNILNWNNSYKYLSDLVHELGVTINCGILPNKESDISLIEDFCEKSDLTLHHEIKDTTQQVRENPSFNKDIIEAINIAATYNLDVPSPHESNKILDLLSHKMIQPGNYSPEFLYCLKSYIDTYFENANNQLCRKYDLREDYFAPPVRFSKPEILNMIIHENQRRALNYPAIIDNNRILAGKMIELCLQLTNDSHGMRANQSPLRESK